MERWCGGVPRPVTGLNLFETEIKVSKEARYLGVVLESKLNWSSHLEYACGKVTQAYIGPARKPSDKSGGWGRITSVGCQREAKKALDNITRMML